MGSEIRTLAAARHWWNVFRNVRRNTIASATMTDPRVRKRTGRMSIKKGAISSPSGVRTSARRYEWPSSAVEPFPAHTVFSITEMSLVTMQSS